MMIDSEYKELPINNDLHKRKEYLEVAKGLQKINSMPSRKH